MTSTSSSRRATRKARRRIGAYQHRGGMSTLLPVGQRVPYFPVWNVTGQPAAAVPWDFDGDGLPISVQLVGRPFEEATLLSLSPRRSRPHDRGRTSDRRCHKGEIARQAASFLWRAVAKARDTPGVRGLLRLSVRVGSAVARRVGVTGAVARWLVPDHLVSGSFCVCRLRVGLEHSAGTGCEGPAGVT